MQAVGELRDRAPSEPRKGVGLCLSGGGFRATLFHLGALRRMNELDVLSQLDAVSSVSGGSIIAAKISTALPWPLTSPVPTDRWNALVARPIREFTRKDRRTKPILSRLWPGNWSREDTAVHELAAVYESELTNARLADLPGHPRFTMCATDMAFGVNWIFERDRMGDYLAGYVAPPPPTWTLGRAVAASSCFPPVFNPMRVDVKPHEYAGGKFPLGRQRDDCLSDLRLTDGGTYDNMGLEPVWKKAATVLVSDGGGLFDRRPDSGLAKRLMRYTAIVENQARAVRKRWLIADFRRNTFAGTYWGIATHATDYDPGGPTPTAYSDDVAANVIAPIRTDLDEFSNAEAAVLENHGYLLADIALRRHVPALLHSTPPLVVPHPDWMDEARVRSALRNSHDRKFF